MQYTDMHAAPIHKQPGFQDSRTPHPCGGNLDGAKFFVPCLIERGTMPWGGVA